MTMDERDEALCQALDELADAEETAQPQTHPDSPFTTPSPCCCPVCIELDGDELAAAQAEHDREMTKEEKEVRFESFLGILQEAEARAERRRREGFVAHVTMLSPADVRYEVTVTGPASFVEDVVGATASAFMSHVER